MVGTNLLRRHKVLHEATAPQLPSKRIIYLEREASESTAKHLEPHNDKNVRQSPSVWWKDRAPNVIRRYFHTWWSDGWITSRYQPSFADRPVTSQNRALDLPSGFRFFGVRRLVMPEFPRNVWTGNWEWDFGHTFDTPGWEYTTTRKQWLFPV